VIDYPMLERIHYLLVAGFDVFGNVGHQVSTRAYMDFLRMEGEHNYLLLLPLKHRAALVRVWYRDLDREAQRAVEFSLAMFTEETSVRYRTATPERELHHLLEARVAAVNHPRYALSKVDNSELREAMQRLADSPPHAATLWPELSFVSVALDGGARQHFTVLRDSAHTNLSELLHEAERRVATEDRLTVVRGFIGAYPSALYRVRAQSLSLFVNAATSMNSEQAARQLHRHFGVRRVTPDFWSHSDMLTASYRKLMPGEAGLFDYGRLLPEYVE
jgi:hypothetical protein